MSECGVSENPSVAAVGSPSCVGSAVDRRWGNVAVGNVAVGNAAVGNAAVGSAALPAAAAGGSVSHRSSYAVTLAPGSELHLLHKPLPLRWGGELQEARLAYELTGPAHAPCIVVQGGISAGSHVCATARDRSHGWWESLVGAGRAIDTDRYRVLSVDYLGGVGASTGASALRSANQSEPQLLTSHDQARATAELLDHLGIAQLEAFVGCSYGGMVALAFAEGFADRLKRLIVVSAAHRSHPLATAWRSLQRRVLRMGASVAQLHASSKETHVASEAERLQREALSLARGMGMTSYRTATELEARFDGVPTRAGALRFPVEEYLLARGAAFCEEFTSESLQCLSQAIDLHQVNPAAILVPTHLLAVASDQLVPEWLMRDLCQQLPQGELTVIDSLYGHDAFLKEVTQLSPFIRAVVEGVQS